MTSVNPIRVRLRENPLNTQYYIVNYDTLKVIHSTADGTYSEDSWVSETALHAYKYDTT